MPHMIGRRPLHQAVEYDRFGVVERLLEAKAEVRAENSWDTTTPLHYVKSGEVVTILVEAKGDINVEVNLPQKSVH